MRDYFRGKRVLITGHNGFKGSWLTMWLIELGALVSGVSLQDNNQQSMFNLLGLRNLITNYEFDIRNKELVNDTLKKESPEIIFHLAAQPLVIESYEDPFYTHTVNYIGTLNLLEAVRLNPICKKIIIITSDKVYRPQLHSQPLNEDSPLGGIDPYSASKSAVELLVQSYRESYFNEKNIQCLTARAGNVIGYGDWSNYRLLPDVYRSILNNTVIQLRNPSSVRPWQDINDVCHGYLLLCKQSEKLIKENIYSVNFGPDKSRHTVLEIVTLCQKVYPGILIDYKEFGYQETKLLVLDTSLARNKLGWNVRKSILESMEDTLNRLNLHVNQDYKTLAKSIRLSIIDYIDS